MYDLVRNSLRLSTINDVGDVPWENAFKFKLNDILYSCTEFEDVQGLSIGHTLSWLSSTTISISSGQCISDDISTDLSTTSPTTVTISSVGLNALDTGTVASGNWYYLWCVKNMTNGQVGFVLSLSSTTPTFPSGFTKKRLLGAIIVDSGPSIRRFTQVSTGSLCEFMYDQAHVSVSSVTPTANTWTSYSVTSSVPPNTVGIFTLNCIVTSVPGGNTGVTCSIRTTGSGSSTGYFNVLLAAVTLGILGENSLTGLVPVTASPSIDLIRDTAVGTVTMTLLCQGFRFERA